MSAKYELGTTMDVDLDEVNSVIHSQEFAQFLLSHTTEFSSAAYILQALLDRIAADTARVDTE